MTSPKPSPASPGAFPRTRLRRTRIAPWVRRLTAETRLGVEDLVWPLFLREDESVPQTIETLPGVLRLTPTEAVAAAVAAHALGIPAVAPFPFVAGEARTPDCALAFSPDNLVCRTVRAIKSAVPELGVICDVALDPYSDTGHDGLLAPDGIVLNDETVALLVRQGLVLAEAGADTLAPSDMMDGRVRALRDALETAGATNVLILSYAAKYASAWYGPFRDAVGARGVLRGDKRNYQMNPANGDEALREVATDLQEGADMVMVKPGLAYLDIVYRVKERFGVPTFVYQVSGEYAMLEYAARAGAFDRDAALLESLLCCKRAGADGIFTYAALEVARKLAP